ncbi:MAG TPA: rhodanese-like domain-containing protein [Candidatus Dormibacteraeota bacterium]|jgi:rhodanese-related sulfurtransferase|nr:rhodanese-like domain-containing protein [Candidatus Dormibacteraeota bacterium]
MSEEAEGPPTGKVPAARIDDVLRRARARYTRLTPSDAAVAQAGGALLVDTRSEAQRRQGGNIPGALTIERNHLEWRLDPTSPNRVPEVRDHAQQVIVVCAQGYSSSLAAASLLDLGLARATDVIGGFEAWSAAGLPVDRPH